jgi:hypothetical protein
MGEFMVGFSCYSLYFFLNYARELHVISLRRREKYTTERDEVPFPDPQKKHKSTPHKTLNDHQQPLS